MLELQNVCKTYKTKSKVITQALVDVNLEIEDRGMVFILGKSGSGKSTLLNLLGGLDSPTGGEIFVDGNSMQKFSARDYANYRNSYIGFVFQEFNLLADFNVRDNVALALKLNRAGNEDEKVLQALKQVELDETYLSRRIGEMSGGEKQRIAIARAIIKDSKMILADEPTGNLDSATGESIWNILKTLSKERLVVVVSHDRESAEKYADRTIEISDGKVISDVGVQPAANQAAPQRTAEKPAKPAHLSFASRLKMGWHNLSLHKVKTTGTVLVTIVALFAIVFMQMFLRYSAGVTLAKHIKRQGIDYFCVSQGSISENGYFETYNRPFEQSTVQYIDKHTRYIKNGIIERKQDILDFGLTFVGEALELDDNSYYATTELLNQYYQYSEEMEVEIDGEYVKLSESAHPISFLVGKKVTLGGVKSGSVLAGVIDTKNVVNVAALSEFYYRIGFNGIAAPTSVALNLSASGNYALWLGKRKHDGPMSLAANSEMALSKGVYVVVTANGLVTDSDSLQLADDEIVLPYNIYSVLFNAEGRLDYVNFPLSQALKIPKEIGQTISLEFRSNKTNGLYVRYEGLKIAGVSFAQFLAGTTQRDETWEIGLSEALIRQVNQDFSTRPVTVQTSSIRNLSWFATQLRSAHNGAIQSAGYIDVWHTDANPMPEDAADLAYGFQDTVSFMSFIFLAVGLFLTLIFFLLVINLISFSITNRKREIGILKALGASDKDVSSIFLLETVIISAICFVVALALSLVLIWGINTLFSNIFQLCEIFRFFYMDFLTVAILVASAFGLTTLAALVPLRKISKLNPIDAIRNE